MECHDTTAVFAISDGEPIPLAKIEVQLAALLESWSPSVPYHFMLDSELMIELQDYLNGLINSRVNHVRSWLDCNLARFQGEHAAIGNLRRKFDNLVTEMQTSIQLCGAQCASCYLLCIRNRLHVGDHNCNTDHKCAYNCGFCEDNLKPCGTRCAILSLFDMHIEEIVASDILGSICRWSVCA